jgi:predicted enzyme related to lactoylglutathione lyase
MSNQSKFGEFCWNELATFDVEAAKKFYGKVFGWEFIDHNMGDTTYTMIQINGQPHGAGIWAIPKEEKQISPKWITYIAVDNIEASLEAAQKEGATVVKPVTPAGDFGLLAIIIDPTGADIALWQCLQQ